MKLSGRHSTRAVVSLIALLLIAEVGKKQTLRRLRVTPVRGVIPRNEESAFSGTVGKEQTLRRLRVTP